MKKITFLVFLFCIGCSQTNCDEEMTKLLELRMKGWQNCNGSATCIKKIESDYQSRVDKLNCD